MSRTKALREIDLMESIARDYEAEAKVVVDRGEGSAP
jgi:hypothetical protein